MNKQTLVVFAAVVLLMVGFVAATELYQGQQAAEAESRVAANADRLVRPDSVVIGDPAAKVTVVEFFDPGCETCRAFYPWLEEILAMNPGRIKLVMRYAPFHHGADTMVAVLEAARRQDRYVEVLEAMYDTQPEWASHHAPDPAAFFVHLPATGVDMAKLQADMADPAIAARIARDLDDAAALGVTKTPGFFVDGVPLEPFGQLPLKRLIEERLAAAYP